MWLSLVEHWHGVPGVAGSSPVIPIFLFTKENIFYAHHNKQGIQNDVHPVVFIIQLKYPYQTSCLHYDHQNHKHLSETNFTF